MGWDGESRLYDIIDIKERSADSQGEYNLGRQTKLQRNDYNDEDSVPLDEKKVKQKSDMIPLAEVFGQYDD
jgi:hypothetical protein